MGDGVMGSDWTYEMPPGKLVGNLHMLTEERYAALLAAEARIAELERERDCLAMRLAVLEAAVQDLIYGDQPVLLGVKALHEALVKCDQMEAQGS